MRIQKFFPLLLIIITTSCDHEYREYDKKSFATMSWTDGQRVTFAPEIKDVEKSYRVMLGIRHHYGLNVEKFGVRVTMTSPSGKDEVFPLEVRIKDGAGKQIGDCMGDICDLETVISEEITFSEAGVYQFVVTHLERGYQIPGIMEVGLIIDARD